jgi:hypothetical protein
VFADDIDIRVAIELDVSTAPIGFVATVIPGTGFVGSELLLEAVAVQLRPYFAVGHTRNNCDLRRAILGHLMG